MGLHILVLAGGSGTRLWPLSRAGTPKHLLPLGTHGGTLLRDTVERVVGLGDSVHVVTAAGQAEACRRALDGLDLPDDAVIAEPEARGTGPALGLATHWIAQSDPDAVICSVHADHHVSDVSAYRAAVFAAAGWATATGGLATVGITPTHPATGFGYIEVGERRDPSTWVPTPTAADTRRVRDRAGRLEANVSRGFHEKPTFDVARAFVASGHHLWNLGLFAWPASVFLDELRRSDQALDEQLRAVVAARRDGDEAAAAAAYAEARSCAVEPLVFERTPQLTVVRAGFAWSDLGSWSDLAEARRADGAVDVRGNVTEGDVVLIDSEGCMVASRGDRLVSIIGASNLVVVDTGDAVLVVPADRAQSVKEVVDALKAAGRTDLV